MFFGLAGQASAATYYVSPTGSNTSPYDTWAKAANQIATISALNPGAGTHTVYIAPGAYTTSVGISNVNWNSSVWQGTSAHGSTSLASAGQVFLTSASTYPLRIYSDAVTMKAITVKDSPVASVLLYYDGTNATLEDFIFSNGGISMINVVGGTNLTVKRGLFQNNGLGPSIFFNGGSGRIVSSRFESYGSALANYHIQNISTGAVTVDNSDIQGGAVTPVYNSGTGSITVTNSIIKAGSGYNTKVATQIGGTLSIDHSLLIFNWNQSGLQVDKFFSGTVGDTNNIKISNPKFIRHQRQGIIVPSVDDSGNWDYARQIAGLLGDRGMQGTFFVNSYSVAYYLAGIQSVENVGSMEIGFHGRTHSDLSQTGSIFSVTAAGKTINVDRTANTITVSDLGTVTNFKTKTLTTIRTELTAMGCTLGAVTTNLSTDLTGESIADSGGVQASPYSLQLLIDTTAASGFYKDEIADGKTEIDVNP